MAIVSVVTPSYNKHEYVGEAIESVLNQTLTDFEYWVMENSDDKMTRDVVREQVNRDDRIIIVEQDFSTGDRKTFYPPAKILNTLYSELSSKYIFYLSDDDLMMPTCLEEMVGFLEAYDEIHVVYHAQGLQIIRHNRIDEYDGIKTCGILGGKTGEPVKCRIDGGQIMHETACLKKIDQPYFPEGWNTAGICDGLFMEKLGEQFEFHPMPHDEPLTVKRRTHKSTWTQARG